MADGVDNKSGTLTGWVRRRKTSARVKFADVASRSLITAAGIGTIVAVVMMCLFLVSEVIPLFAGGSVDKQREAEAPGADEAARPIHMAINDYGHVGWAYFDDGTARVFEVRTGKVLREQKLFEQDDLPVSMQFDVENRFGVFGFDHGRVQIARFTFETDHIKISDYFLHRPGFESVFREGELWVARAGDEAADNIDQFGPPQPHEIGHIEPSKLLSPPQDWHGQEQPPQFVQATEPIGPLGTRIGATDPETLRDYLLARRGLETGIDKDDAVLWLFVEGSEAARAFDQDQVPGDYITVDRAGPLGLTVRAVENEAAELWEEADAFAERYKQMAVRDTSRVADRVVELTSEGLFRRQAAEIELEEPVDFQPDAADEDRLPVVLVDMAELRSGPVITALQSDGTLHVAGTRRRFDMRLGEHIVEARGGEMSVPIPEGRDLPDFLKFEGRADSALLIWRDGHAVRLDTRNRREPVVAETLELLDEPGAEITAMHFMVGKMTLVVGDTTGRLSTWFRVRPGPPDPRPDTSDGSTLVRAQVLPGRAEDAHPTTMGGSTRRRTLVAGYSDGSARMFYITSSRLMWESREALPGGEPAAMIGLLPRDRGMFAASERVLAYFDVEYDHPEATVRAIFDRVWYEGSSEPRHTWQSSAGTDEFEPKYGMIPLIFGTVKATFYTMLFGAPIALLAAVFTSEFLHPRARAAIKPVIEMMASLPSVVLGFLAALVFAAYAEQVVTGLLTITVTAPAMILLGAYFWQLLPSQAWSRLQWLRFPVMMALLPLAVMLAMTLGPMIERWLFAGDIRLWLGWEPHPEIRSAEADPHFDNPIGGWIMLLLPLCALGVAIFMAMVINPLLRGRMRGMNRLALGSFTLGKFIFGFVMTLGLAWLLAWLISGGPFGFWHWDARGYMAFGDTGRDMDIWGIDLSMMGGYAQRNAMVVGFVMGFAIIPIIYTIAEDALSAVPQHLRAASLGAGATPWQTAVRIIIPTAMSGLFSACMIGLGRAVGETMIVLMAAGGTPLLEMNLFNGFRTLSANIAIELPEAAVGGTNYRMLFLAALTLFAMTFVINTVAEVIRLRFRRRAFQL